MKGALGGQGAPSVPGSADPRIKRIAQFLKGMPRSVVCLVSNHTQTTTTSGSGVTIASGTVFSSTVIEDGDAIRITASGQFTGTGASTVQILLRFGGVSVFDTGTLSSISSSQSWQLEALLIRKTSILLTSTATFSTTNGYVTVQDYDISTNFLSDQAITTAATVSSGGQVMSKILHATLIPMKQGS